MNTEIYKSVAFFDSFDCTDFFIRPNVLMTAAHCVWDFKRRQLHSVGGVYPGLNSWLLTFKKYLSIDAFIIPPEYKRTGSIKDDYALIILEDYDGKKANVLDLSKHAQVSYAVATLLGYPASESGKLYSNECFINSDCLDEALMVSRIRSILI